MSTIKVNSIKNTSTDDGGIAIDNSGHVQIDGQQLPTAGALSNRNLLANGAMQVRQRPDVTGITITQYVLDRFQFIINSMGAFSISRSTEAPAGFSNSLKIDCTTADASPASGDYMLIGQKIEGQNLQHLDFGSASAKKLTYSFWVRSPKTGTHILEFYQDGNARQVSATYTVSTANTWEHKQVTIDGDTASALANDNTSELAVYHWLGAGSNFTSGTLNTSGFAASTNANRVVGGINLADSTSNEFYLTGAQLEVGEKATPFEHRSYGDEFDRCLRYYQQLGGPVYVPVGSGVQGSSTNTSSNINVNMRAPMRTGPTITFSNLILTDRHAFDNQVNQHSGLKSSATGVYANFKSATNGGAHGRAILLTVHQSNPGYLALHAEL